MKNLKYLQKNGVLKSKSYGLGRDVLWSLKPHPILKDYDVKPPTSEIHTFKYQHEKECAEVFVSLILADAVSDWHQHKKLSTGIIPDRTVEIDDFTLHIENERGTQGYAKVIKKLEKYKDYWRETREDFQVLFLVKDPESFTQLFNEVRVPYLAAKFDDFLEPLTCTLFTAYGSKNLPDVLPNSVPDGYSG
jgi:hypothetical protein